MREFKNEELSSMLWNDEITMESIYSESFPIDDGYDSVAAIFCYCPELNVVLLWDECSSMYSDISEIKDIPETVHEFMSSRKINHIKISY